MLLKKTTDWVTWREDTDEEEEAICLKKTAMTPSVKLPEWTTDKCLGRWCGVDVESPSLLWSAPLLPTGSGSFAYKCLTEPIKCSLFCSLGLIELAWLLSLTLSIEDPIFPFHILVLHPPVYPSPFPFSLSLLVWKVRGIGPMFN